MDPQTPLPGFHQPLFELESELSPSHKHYLWCVYLSLAFRKSLLIFFNGNLKHFCPQSCFALLSDSPVFATPLSGTYLSPSLFRPPSRHSPSFCHYVISMVGSLGPWSERRFCPVRNWIHELTACSHG